MLAWAGLSNCVLFANADGGYIDSTEPAARVAEVSGALARRAGALAAGNDVVLVAYEPAALAPGATIGATVLVARRTGDLCSDLTDDGLAMKRLEELVRRSSRPMAAWAQIYTPTMDLLSHELEHHGLERRLLPCCSGVSVGFWNTKAGGSELLADAAGDDYPVSYICNSPEDVHDRMTRRADWSWVVKVNRSMGGIGVAFLEGSETVSDIARLVTVRASDGSTAGKSVPTKPHRPYRNGEVLVLQRRIGDPAGNISPTADFMVDPAGRTELVALAEQILDDGIRYIGSRSSSIGCDVVNRIVAIGHQVGTRLAEHGYSGLFNLDYVLTQDGQLAVVEINLRQSAPLDQSLTMRRRYGTDWADRLRFSAAEPTRSVEHVSDDFIYYGDPLEPSLTMSVAPRADH